MSPLCPSGLFDEKRSIVRLLRAWIFGLVLRVLRDNQSEN
jgi:hypothetical protein